MASLLNLLDHLEEFTIERDKAIYDPNSVPNLPRLARREDNTHCRLCRALHHVLTLFVEAGGNGVMLFETNK